MFKIVYSTNFKGDIRRKEKEFSEMEDIDNFIKTRRLIGGFGFHSIIDETGREYPTRPGKKRKTIIKLNGSDVKQKRGQI